MFALKQPPAAREADPGIPDPVAQSPDLAKLLDQRRTLHDALPVLQAELDASLAQKGQGKKRGAVAALLAGRPKPTHRETGEIAEEQATVRAAIEEIDRQIVQARLVVSQTITGMVAPRHKELVGEMVEAMLAARVAFVNYLEFVDQLNGRQIAWTSLRPMHPLFLGDPNAKYSDMACWLREAADYGFIDRNDLPEAMRHG